MAAMPEFTMSVTKYRIVFFPFASLTICGDLKVLKVFGFNVYQKAGAAQKLLWVKW